MTIISNAAAERRESARQSTGEFGEQVHSAPELTLGTESPWPDDLGGHIGDWNPSQWGSVDVEYGARTPWGPAQSVDHVADGVVFVSTAGHGGYKLSPERNRAIPTAYRDRSGWYEEDSERRIVEFYHFDGIARPDADRTRDERLTELDQGLRDWYPEKWEKVNGRTLEPGESYIKDQLMWGANNADEYVMRSQQIIEDDLILVTARRQSTGDEDRFILTREQRDAARNEATDELGSNSRFRVPAGVKAQPRPEPEPLKPAYTTVPSTDGLTAAAAKKVQADLDKRWQLRADGSVKTLRQQIEDGHITSKRVYINDSGVREFYLDNDNTSSALKVSKATFDAFEAPDTRTPKDLALDESRIASAKRDKVQRRADSMWRLTPAIQQELREATAAANEAYRRYEEIRDA